MKKILVALLLTFPLTAFASINTPPSDSTCGQVYGYEVCVWATYATGFDDEYGLRSSYKGNDDVWVFLAEKTNFISNMTTKESTDNYFAIFVDGINSAIESKLKPISVEPDFGIGRIKWLVQSNLSFSNNQLVYAP